MIGVEKNGAVATVYVDRPDAMNALDVATLTELRDRLAELRDDDHVRAVGEKSAVGAARWVV